MKPLRVMRLKLQTSELHFGLKRKQRSEQFSHTARAQLWCGEKMTRYKKLATRSHQGEQHWAVDVLTRPLWFLTQHCKGKLHTGASGMTWTQNLPLGSHQTLLPTGEPLLAGHQGQTNKEYG